MEERDNEKKDDINYNEVIREIRQDNAHITKTLNNIKNEVNNMGRQIKNMKEEMKTLKNQYNTSSVIHSHDSLGYYNNDYHDGY